METSNNNKRDNNQNVMQMKLTHYIYISAALAMLAACHDDVDPVYTVGEEDNAIQLRAGIVEGGAALTRAESDGNHSKHVSLTQNTKIVWKADGQWKHGDADARNVSQKSLATIGAASGNHNIVGPYDPVLFWDDYGTADPDNASVGKAKGLSIYAAAVDGKATLPDGLSGLNATTANWQALSWSVYNQKPENGTMLDRDLIVANNLTGDNAFKFEDFKKIKNNASDKNVNAGLLEFCHMMSKVTINLKAGEGFPLDGGASIRHFNATPIVQLGQGVSLEQTAYAYTSCTVNVETGDVAATVESKKIIVAEHDDTATSGWSDTYHCLVVPGTPFKGTTQDIIAKIKADDNVYYVDGKAIRKAIYKYYNSGKTDSEIDAAFDTDAALTSVKNYLAQPGINYILKVIVNKTGIEVTATLVNWSDIEAGEVSPKINIDANFGSTSATGSINSFCLYRSASDVKSTPMVQNDMSGYSKGLATSTTNNYFPYETVVNKSGDPATWSMATQLYWPTHNTHYHFRGVAPATSVATESYGKEATETPAPHVEALSADDATQIIKVWDAAFGADLFPSNLAIGKPIIAADTKCNNPDHDQVNLNDYGICATEGKINLEFAYMMSQVEVKLETEEGTSKAVRLEGAQVEIINGLTKGYVTLGGREAKATGDKASHTMNVSDAENHIYKDAIVPQKLFEGESYTETEPNSSTDTRNLRFKVTITNNDAVLYADADEYNTAKGYTSGDPGYCSDFSSLTYEQKTKYQASKDVYYADIAPIRKTVNGVLQSEWVVPADNGKWESGKHYVYTLKLSKTGISIIATLVDWTTVYAEENVWF